MSDQRQASLIHNMHLYIKFSRNILSQVLKIVKNHRKRRNSTTNCFFLIRLPSATFYTTKTQSHKEKLCDPGNLCGYIKIVVSV